MIPFKTLRKPTQAVLETPIAVGKNIAKSVGEYPYRIYKSPQWIKKGFTRVRNAHKTASAEMEKSWDIGGRLESLATKTREGLKSTIDTLRTAKAGARTGTMGGAGAGPPLPAAAAA